MSYLIAQLWPFLLAAFIVGVLAGWFTSRPEGSAGK